MSQTTLTLPMAAARERLSEICRFVQDPRRHAVLTRHGTPVAAVVSLDQLRRIFEAEITETMRAGGGAPSVPMALRGGKRWVTEREAGEALVAVQMDRLAERKLLKRAGLEPVPGGEVAVDEAPPMERRRRRWRFW